MRKLEVLCTSLLFTALAVGQNMGRSYPGYAGCFYGCAPFVPLVSTPMISFETVSSSPVGATNATGGLTAGATNSTLESLPQDVSTDRTQVVWYWGANTVPTPPMGEAGLAMHHARIEERARMEHRPEAAALYIAGPVESVKVMESAAAVRALRKASRTYTNQDIDRINQQTGTVKYDSKTEKIQ
ncbi:MAG: hypothetical protein JO249_11440 [Acidobacteria bacterium]|nr:hypothetical protein [Acidobacteriota bacterium]